MTTIALKQRLLNHKIRSLSLPLVNWKGILASSIALLVALMAWYVISINEMTKGAYLIKQHDKDISALSYKNQSLHMSLAQTDELSRMLARAQAAGFEKTSSVTYMEIFDSSFAQAKP